MTELNTSKFTSVSIEEFFDKDSTESTVEVGIVVFTPHQQKLVDKLMEALAPVASDRAERLQNRIKDIEALAKSIARFPSLLERINTTSSVRTPEALVENIISYQQDGDITLHMPSKAILGKGFLVSKIHTFYSMSKLAKNYAKMDEKSVKEYADETVSMMFTLMAEDVYLNLIKDKTLSMDLRRQLANSLIILWEHRSDQTISDIAPVLQSVWAARRKLAPAFGTMMGTSELLLVTMQMDEQWNHFIKAKLSDPDVSQAMEEFLFGISHEQVLRLKEILRTQGVKSIGRDEVSRYLGERVKTDVSMDYRDFYLLYTVRRDNARSRQRLHLEGPKNTIEDYFIRFVLESNQEKQNKDKAAIKQ
ncbi:MAG: hypothetical protein PUI24_03460 [Spirochaetales bacterium]|nr:hypothetical protein [Spirochaetales bacterium]